jgi:cell division septum initiation protein DivIVA
MNEGGDKVAGTVAFAEEKNGYSKEQVDKYIGKLTEAYQAAFDENQGLLDKYNRLLEENKKLEFLCRTQINAEVISKTIGNMEALARKIIEEKLWIDRLIN